MTAAALVLALLAASAFALGNVLQQKGTLEAPAGEDDPRFLVQILRRPVWLAGAGMQLTGWVLQAAALDAGPLVAVQSLMSLSLVIALPLGARLTDQQVTARIWYGVLAMVAGVVLFLSVGSPQRGTSTPPAAAWWSSGALALVVVGLLARLGRRHPGASRALLFGSAAGVCFAFQAAVTKAFVPLVGDGLRVVVTSWTIYVLIASAVVGFALQQSALKTGVLAPATASSNVVTLFASVLFGITVFGEALSRGGGRLAPALAAWGSRSSAWDSWPGPRHRPRPPGAGRSRGGSRRREPAAPARSAAVSAPFSRVLPLRVLSPRAVRQYERHAMRWSGSRSCSCASSGERPCARLGQNAPTCPGASGRAFPGPVHRPAPER